MTEDFDMNQFKELFVSETREHLSVLNANLLELEKSPNSLDILNDIFRAAHTLKGMAATMGFEKVTELTHSMENVLDKFRTGKLPVYTGVVDVLFDCLDMLESLVDEIVSNTDTGISVQPLIEALKNSEIHAAASQSADFETAKPSAQAPVKKNAAPVPQAAKPKPQETPAPQAAAKPAADKAAPQSNQQQATDIEQKTLSTDHKSQTVRIKVEHLDKLMNLVGELVITKAQLAQIAAKEKNTELSMVINSISQYTTELQEEVLKTRMVPVKQIFDRYPRMVRDLSHKLGKEVDFVMSGVEIEIDRMLLDQINEPLVHLLRNAIDHGIEDIDGRKTVGKHVAGVVRLSARREKGYVWIEVSDDGKGMDVEAIKQKAIEKGIIALEDANQLAENEVFSLICHPGFSMAKEITDVSGRGVGMDVVRNLVEAFNGKLDIKSKKGEGSVFVMQLPLSMAIIQALLVHAGNETYAVPLTNVAEIARIDKQYVKTIDNTEVLLLRNEVIPLVRLSKYFNTGAFSGKKEGDYTVIVELSAKKFGLVVDALKGKQEIVIKTLSGILRNVKSFSGATILGDGRVVLILDVVSVSGG